MVKWYHSLYWRIAIGFVAFLAAILVVQGVLFVWMVARSGRTLPGGSPGRVAETVASELAGALERDATLDVDRYVHEQFAQGAFPFVVVMADGRVASTMPGGVPEPLLRMAHARLRRLGRERPGFEAPEPRERLTPDRQEPDRVDREGMFRVGRPVPIMVAGTMAGVVVVPPRAPFGFLLGRFAPLLALTALGVLTVGTVGASVIIFGPARRRLQQLERAAREFGAGDLSARAPARGGDEIAAVAHAFNSMADALAARAEALAASNRARRQLLADVSHELNTPMTAVRGYIETLTMPELTLDERTRARYLGIIADETARVERIIGDLLDLARLEGGGGALSRDEVATSRLFERIAARHGRAAETSGIVLASTIAPGAEVVFGDDTRLEQALQNLAANAMRFAPPGSTITLRARRVDDGVAMQVEDQGSGIPADHLAHIFDRFYKAEASREAASGGSGLGLSIVKAIVERHGGRISVSSRPGRTVFELVLPRRPAEER